MSGIRGRNTKPEMLIRSALHGRGFRFRLPPQKKKNQLPGNPDIKLPKHNAVIFINGCFWHGHNCHLFKWPSTREDFWRQKIEGNIARDRQAIQTLSEQGWRILIIWECSIRGRTRFDFNELIAIVTEWLISDDSLLSIEGEGENGDNSL
ncbi:very short patch repair endonuclease [Marinobacter subterrani]|nr:very short patch repair endonuclease [Marinobacter subterrani]